MLQFYCQAHIQFMQIIDTDTCLFAHEEPIQGVTLRQVKYETTNEEISLGTSRFTSNEIIGTSGSISFSQGICLMIRSID